MKKTEKNRENGGCQRSDIGNVVQEKGQRSPQEGMLHADESNQETRRQARSQTDPGLNDEVAVDIGGKGLKIRAEISSVLQNAG